MQNYKKIFLLLVTVIFLLSLKTVLSQEEKKITIEWVNSDECASLTRLPRFEWLEDATALLYDTSVDANERTIERLNPATGKRQPAVDRDKTLESLGKILSSDDMPKKLDWPREINNSGDFAVYTYNKDIYLLDIKASEFMRITESDSEEKAVKFSPDGTKIAYVRDNDLYVYDILNQAETRITDDGSETILNATLSYVYWEEIFGRQDTAYWWSNDSDYIAYLKSDDSPVNVMHFVDFAPYQPKIHKQRYPKAGQTNPIVTVHIANIKGEQISHFDASETAYEYIARVKWLPDDQSICVQTLNRDQTKLDMYFMERDSGKANHIMTEQDDGWVEMSNDLYFFKDQRRFIWQSQRNGFAHLYLYRIDGKLDSQITKGEWSVCSVAGGRSWIMSSIASVDEENGWIYFGSKKKSHLERHLYRVKFNGARLEQLTEEDGSHRIFFSSNGKYYFDFYSDMTNPPRLSLHSNDGKLKTVIAESKAEEIKELDLQYPEYMTVKARDGFEMPAVMLKPKDFDPQKKYPVLVNVYGGPGAPTVQNAWSRSIFTDQILLDNGFIVFRFDNRSATDISKKLTNLVVGKMWAECELNDMVDAARWLKKQEYIDANRIGLWGASGGGSYTLLGLTSSKEFAAGVSIAPVTDWHYYDSIWAEAGMKLPQDNPEGYEKTSFIKKAENLHGRLLLVHGTHDDNVHPQNTWSFADALIEAGIQFDMMIYPMRKHGISDKAARIHLFNKMLEFWNRNLKEKQ